MDLQLQDSQVAPQLSCFILCVDQEERASAYIQAGAGFAKCPTESVCDAMPVIWKNFPIESWQAVLQFINSFEKDTDDNIWSPQNIRCLLPYAPARDINKLDACCSIMKKDPSVIVGGGGNQV